MNPVSVARVSFGKKYIASKRLRLVFTRKVKLGNNPIKKNIKVFTQVDTTKYVLSQINKSDSIA